MSSADFFLDAKDTYGAAEPATPGDNLDVTIASKKESVTAQTSNAFKTKIPGFMGSVAGDATDGLSVGQKLFFVAGIVAGCAVFLRSRGTSTAAVGKSKSMA